MTHSISGITEDEKDKLIRKYAACEISWSSLRRRGFGDYLEVLAALGERNLRPPMAPMTGPNVEARQRGIALLRQLLAERMKP